MAGRNHRVVFFIVSSVLFLTKFSLVTASQDGGTGQGSSFGDGRSEENGEDTAGRRKNVLFIVADDMRPEIAALSRGNHVPPSLNAGIHTPNLDTLASQSLVLERAYVQQAVCSPSRASALTGRRPDTTHVYDLDTYFRNVGGNFTTLPQYFKENGYIAKSFGKVFHPGRASGGPDVISWSETPYEPKDSHNYWKLDRQHSWMAVSPYETARMPLPDQLVAEEVIRELQQYVERSGDNPFFFAVGFYKPHLPFVFPEEYLNLYPESDITLPLNNYVSANLPNAAWSNWAELRRYPDIRRWNSTGLENSTLPDDVTRSLRRAYYSAVSYVDDLVGSVLSELKRQGLYNDTIVTFWGDHGWMLGEHGGWCKHNNFELSTHSPMMVRVPGLTDEGATSAGLVEAVDLYPTIVEAAQLPAVPTCPARSGNIALCTEGVSFMQLINRPERPWKTYAFSQYPRDKQKTMGYSVRSERYRYTLWVKFNKRRYRPVWNKQKGAELYDHNVDPDENHNVVDDPQHQRVVRELRAALKRGWRRAIPTV